MNKTLSLALGFLCFAAPQAANAIIEPTKCDATPVFINVKINEWTYPTYQSCNITVDGLPVTPVVEPLNENQCESYCKNYGDKHMKKSGGMRKYSIDASADPFANRRDY